MPDRTYKELGFYSERDGAGNIFREGLLLMEHFQCLNYINYMKAEGYALAVPSQHITYNIYKAVLKDVYIQGQASASAKITGVDALHEMPVNKSEGAEP